MTFPKRGTRKLSVAGRDFNWQISPKRLDYGQSLATVQSGGGSGRILHYWLREGFPNPKEASEVIAFALANGWDPNGSGAPFWVEWSEQAQPTVRASAGARA